ncbi:MAG: 3-hydroxyacyl-CoA dehydrogenase [Anaerolineales bacterium]
MKQNDIHRVLIVGAGTMGQQIAWQCATHGYDVVLYDSVTKVLDNAQRHLMDYSAELMLQGLISPKQTRDAFQRITILADPKSAGQGIDLISESVPEDPKLKGKVFAQFHAICPPHTIFTTNTSTLIPSQFAKASCRPDRLLALHFHPPVWTHNIVDVMPHKGTDPEITACVLNFAHNIGQIPIYLKKENHSYVFNTMFSAVNQEALKLAASSVATVEDIDRAWMGITEMRIGPFGMMDLVGLDTVWHIAHYWAKRAFFIPQLKKNSDFVKSYVDRGWLGVKSERGFYTYPNPSFQNPDFIMKAPNNKP